MSLKYAAAVIIRDQKVLLVRRSVKDDSEPGKWCPVNESIKEGESPEKAVVRGVKEEVGLHFIVRQAVSDDHFGEYVFIGSGTGCFKLKTEESLECDWFSYKEALLLDLAYDYRLVFQKLFDLKLIK